MASAFTMDEGSQLRRSHNPEGLLSSGALRAPDDNRRKNAANAAGASAQRYDEGAIIQRIKHYLSRNFRGSRGKKSSWQGSEGSQEKGFREPLLQRGCKGLRSLQPLAAPLENSPRILFYQERGSIL